MLEDLHWLPMHYQMNFKVITLVFKCIHRLAPSYLKELIKIKKTRADKAWGQNNESDNYMYPELQDTPLQPDPLGLEVQHSGTSYQSISRK